MYDLIKTLSLFAYPLGGFFLLAALAVGLRLFGRPRIAIAIAAFAVAWLWVWSMPATSERLRAGLESQYDYLAVEQVPEGDAIVVLGGAFSRDAAWPYPSAGGSVDRYWHGARLYRAGRAPKIILSGGRHPDRPDDLSEAEAGAQFLGDMGVPGEALLLDNRSRTTHDHIRYLKPLLAEAGIDRLLLVTSATHMRRAEAVFHYAGLEVTPVATAFSVPSDPVITLRRYLPSVGGLSGSTRVVHEWLGYAFYRVRGWL
ncbi:YdcF family protein [Spiribacter sp. 221]|uniref:YdcF family protein n=1 Tax=Spiribacter onubensis TaxID=3122420 RepID=UPI00349FC82F